MFELEPEHLRCPTTVNFDGRILRLGEQHHSLVRTEIGIAKFGMAIETKPLPNEWLEMLGQEIREVERSRLFVLNLVEEVAACKELVAVRASKALYARKLLEQSIQRSTGAAIGIGNEHRALDTLFQVRS